MGDPTEPRWRRIARRLVHETPFFRVFEDEVRTPAGARAVYGVVHSGECVGVLPLVSDTEVLMVRQHRYIAGRRTWEMPTGGVERGETSREAAQRELAEEAGYRAGSLEHLHSFHTSKSSMDETAHLYVGRELTPCEATPDDCELIERRVLPFAEVLRMVVRGEVTDSMTIIAVLLAARQMGI